MCMIKTQLAWKRTNPGTDAYNVNQARYQIPETDTNNYITARERDPASKEIKVTFQQKL